jgi:hypothetical protein
MSKRPNFGLSNTAMAGKFALDQPEDSGWVASKPFDGFKTSQNTSKKPFDFRTGKISNTDYRQPMGHAALEKNLVDDIKGLDWELESIGGHKKHTFQSEANMKPQLFTKKKNFNDTGETKATVGTAPDDWDLPASMPKTKKAVPAIKEATAEASDWNLAGVYSPPKKGKAIKAGAK